MYKHVFLIGGFILLAYVSAGFAACHGLDLAFGLDVELPSMEKVYTRLDQIRNAPLASGSLLSAYILFIFKTRFRR